MPFIDREWELAALEQFWTSRMAQCISVIGRRRVGKTFLIEHFAVSRRAVYYRCELRGTSEQLALFGMALAEMSGDPVVIAQPPATWPAVFALIERLAGTERLLLVLDEIPYWVARDDSLPSVLQNWWYAHGRTLNIVLILCGSAVQMMERLLTGEAPLAGCLTGRIPVRPFDFRTAARMLNRSSPIEALEAYGILGGVPLYLGFFDAQLSVHDNILQAIATPTARLYVEPDAIFAAYHATYDAHQAQAVLRAIARGGQRWSEIISITGLSAAQLTRIITPLIGDLGLIERVLPVTESRESRGYHTQYHLTDNYFRFWFRFIEPLRGAIEFGDSDRIVAGIMAELPQYMGPPYEALCRDWVRMASAGGALPTRVGGVGTWWAPDHEVDIVGLDEHRHVAVVGECKWRNQGFSWSDLQVYLGHVQALGTAATVRPDVWHILCSKTGFDDGVRQWAAGTRALLLEPADLLASFEVHEVT